MKMLKDKFIRLFVNQFCYECKSVPLQTGPVYDDYVSVEATFHFIRFGGEGHVAKNLYPFQSALTVWEKSFSLFLW